VQALEERYDAIQGTPRESDDGDNRGGKKQSEGGGAIEVQCEGCSERLRVFFDIADEGDEGVDGQG